MARNGSGTYSLPSGNPVTTGATISSTVHNNTMSDIATALTGSLAKNGETTPTANLPMGTYRHTGVGNASARTDYASAAQVQDGALVYLTSVSGTNTITATGAVSMAAYATGHHIVFIPANTNTGATTINVNSIGAKNIYAHGLALVGGELVANVPVIAVYDGTQYQIVGGARPAVQLVATQTASSSATISFDANTYPSLFNGTFRKVIFELATITPATDDQYIIMRIGTGATPTYQSGASAYGWGGSVNGNSGSTHTGSGTDSFATGMALPRAVAGSGVGLGTGTSEHLSASIEVWRLGQAEEARFSWHGSWRTASAAINHFEGGGSYGSSTAITGVQWLMSSGNIASGYFSAYGVR